MTSKAVNFLTDLLNYSQATGTELPTANYKRHISSPLLFDRYFKFQSGILKYNPVTLTNHRNLKPATNPQQKFHW